MQLSDIKNYGLVMKRRTAQACNLNNNIIKKVIFSGETKLIEVGQGRRFNPSLSPLVTHLKLGYNYIEVHVLDSIKYL